MSDLVSKQENGDINICKKLLEERGVPHLVGLLQKENEIELFQTISEYASQKNKNGRIPKPKLLKKYQIKASLIPASTLPVVCALGKEGLPEITSIGEIIRYLYKKLQADETEGHLFLTSGGAKEAIGAKALSKSRIGKGKAPTIKDYDPPDGSPLIDGDFLFTTNIFPITEEKIGNLLKKITLRSSLEIKVISSKSRPFSRIDIGKVFNKNVAQDSHWSRYWQSYGHITFPEFRGNHSPLFSFIQNIMGEGTSSPNILLIPTEGKEGFIGAYIDFFPESKLFKNVYYQKGKYSKPKRLETLRPNLIYWPSIAFPFNQSPSEALVHLLHFLRNCTWDDQFLLIPTKTNNNKLKLLLTKRFQKRDKEMKELSKETSLYLAQNIVYFIADNPILIGREPDTLRGSAKRILQTMKPMLNGDPYIGFIYLLAAGENPTDAPVYGTGFIDPKGFFPELYEFLHQENRLDRIIKLMAETEAGPAMKGWPAFLNFLYQETGNDLKYLARLLNPNFCSMEIYPTLVEDFISKDLNLSSPPSFLIPATST